MKKIMIILICISTYRQSIAQCDTLFFVFKNKQDSLIRDSILVQIWRSYPNRSSHFFTSGIDTLKIENDKRDSVYEVGLNVITFPPYSPKYISAPFKKLTEIVFTFPKDYNRKSKHKNKK